MQLQVRCKFSSKKVVGLEDDAEAGGLFFTRCGEREEAFNLEQRTTAEEG